MFPPGEPETRAPDRAGASTCRASTERTEVGRVLVEQREAAIREGLAPSPPSSPFAQRVGRVLHEDRHQVAGPAGATVGSTTDGIVHSSTGRAEGRPYLASSKAPLDVVEGRGRRGWSRGAAGPALVPGQAMKSGSSASRHVDLERRRLLVGDARGPRPGTRGGRQRLGSEQAQEGHVGVGRCFATIGARRSSPSGERPRRSRGRVAPPGWRANGARRSGSPRPGSRAARARAWGEPAHAAAHVAPGLRARPSVIAHHVVEEDVAGAGRRRARPSPR